MSRKTQLLLILPPAVLSIVLFGRPLLTVSQACPTQFSELKEITAPVDKVVEHRTNRMEGRSVRAAKSYRLCLAGHSGSLYIPDEFRFDQNAFLRWAGTEQVTFLYARTAGRLTVYQIQRGDQVFLDYTRARERLTVTFLTSLLVWLASLLFGLSGALYLPEFLSPGDKAKRGERILYLTILALLLVTLALLTRLARQPKITETPAGTAARWDGESEAL